MSSEEIDEISWDEATNQILMIAVVATENAANALHQLKAIAPEYDISFQPSKSTDPIPTAGYAIYFIECRLMGIFEDLQRIRNIRQARPLVPIIAISENADPTFQAGIYSSGATEVINPNVDAQLLKMKLTSYIKLSESGTILEIKNQESIRAMKSLREALDNLKKEMNSRIAAESEKAIAQKQAEQHKQIREIMDHLSEGYFWVTSDKKISEQTSKSCAIIFGKEIAGLEIGGQAGPCLGFEDESKEGHMAACLDQLFENFMPTSVTLSMMPRKVILSNQKIIMFDYTIIENNEKNPEKVIIQAKDITAIEEQNKKNESIHNKSQILINILRSKETFQNFVTDFAKMIQDLLASGINDSVLANRILHTLKGNSALFGLSDVAHIIHETEGLISKSQKEELKGILVDYAAKIESSLKDFLSENKDVLQVTYGAQAEKFVIDSAVIDSLQEISSRCSEDIKKEIEGTLDLIKMRPASFFTSMYESAVRKIATMKEKKIDFKLSGLDVKIDVKRYEPVFKNIIHAIRNSCDHGIETPSERRALGKGDIGTVELNIKQDGKSGIYIQIKDDGKGLDVEALKEKAIEGGIASKEKLESMTREQIFELIFLDGLSTAKEVTDISGRGVGMSALKSIVEELGGNIKTSSVLHQGTTLDLFIPHKKKVHDVKEKMRSGFSIMICEDEQALSQIYTEALTRKGFKVKAFDNGMDALLELSQQNYDLIITDLRMPGLGGETVVKKIRELSNETMTTPIIVISGFVSEQIRTELSQYSQVSILEKPVAIRKIIPVIEENLGIAQQVAPIPAA